VPSDIPGIREAIARSGAKMLIFDPLVSRLEEKVDANKDQSIRRALTPLGRRRAHRYGGTLPTPAQRRSPPTSTRECTIRLCRGLWASPSGECG
jgi:hypothetical protein